MAGIPIILKTGFCALGAGLIGALCVLAEGVVVVAAFSAIAISMTTEIPGYPELSTCYLEQASSLSLSSVLSDGKKNIDGPGPLPQVT